MSRPKGSRNHAAPDPAVLAIVERIEQAGPLLFGPDWLTPMAQGLGISPRLIRYWRNREAKPGGGNTPDDLERRLHAIYLRERERRAADLAKLDAFFAGSDGE